MKNKALIITILSFFGLITLIILGVATSMNMLAIVPFILLFLSSFTLGICNLMVGSKLKTTKWFSIITLSTFALTGLTLFSPYLYASFWNVVFALHIGIITWTLYQVSPPTYKALQITARIFIILTAALFLSILFGFMQHSMVFDLLKISLFLVSGILILQFILQNYTQKN